MIFMTRCLWFNAADFDGTFDFCSVLQFYGTMCFVYGMYAAVWIILCFRYLNELLRIQHWIGAVILLGEKLWVMNCKTWLVDFGHFFVLLTRTLLTFCCASLSSIM